MLNEIELFSDCLYHRINIKFIVGKRYLISSLKDRSIYVIDYLFVIIINITIVYICFDPMEQKWLYRFVYM